MTTSTPSTRPALRPRRARPALACLAALLLAPALIGAGAAPEGPVGSDGSSESGGSSESSGRSGTGEEVIWSLTPVASEAAAEEGADGGDRVSFRHEVDPGASVEDAVELTNHSNREITYTLAASDGVIGPTGAFDMLAPGVESERAGTWIELAEDSVTVPSGESVEVPFTLTVPENATPGDHPAGIAASVSPEDAEDAQVSTVARVGTRVHLRVTGEVVPAIEVGGLEVDYTQNWNPFAPGTVTARWSAENTGNVRMGSDQDLTVSGPFGWFGGTEPATELRELLPGQVVELEMTTEAWPLFVADAEVASTPTVVGEDEVTAELQRTSASTTSPALPLPQLILLVLLGLLVWWLITRRRRRKAAFDAAVAKAAAERAAGEAPTAEEASAEEAPAQRPAGHPAEEASAQEDVRVSAGRH